jgi:hypothetical protein
LQPNLSSAQQNEQQMQLFSKLAGAFTISIPGHLEKLPSLVNTSTLKGEFRVSSSVSHRKLITPLFAQLYDADPTCGTLCRLALVFAARFATIPRVALDSAGLAISTFHANSG